MTTLHLRKSIDRSSWRYGFLLIAFACFAPLSAVQAKLPKPTPDGSYPNDNTAEGDDALFNVTTGARNTAIGDDALFKNTSGNDNTASGAGALQNNTASANTATGSQALFNNTTGVFNTANGVSALFSNTTGVENTATGLNALFSNTTGSANTATGVSALFSNTTGIENTATGESALSSNTTGSSNIAVGFFAGLNLDTGSNNIDIFDPGASGESNTIRIGTQGTQTATYIAGIFGATASTPVGVDSNGHLGVLSISSARFKDKIKPMDKTSEAILALKPVTFRYKKELDPKNTPQFGLVAEEVEKVNPALITRDGEGKPYTVRYDAVNAMLLNEFLKEHRKVEEQGATIAQQKKDFASELARQQRDFNEKFAQQQKQIEALTAGLQKVSDQMELNRPAPQVVANP